MSLWHRRTPQRSMQVNMDGSDNEDVSFLADDGDCEQDIIVTGLKRRPYQTKQKMECSQAKTAVISTIIIAFVICVALIAAFARPFSSEIKQTNATSLGDTVARATNGEIFPWTDVRLPTKGLPQSYVLFIHPNLTVFSFKGRAEIKLKIIEDTDFIVLHMADMNITSYSLYDSASQEVIKITKMLQYVKNQQLFFRTAVKLKAGSFYSLHIAFAAELRDKLSGFYKSTYTASNGEKRYIAVTQFEPVDARAAFPCFDEPEMKATFEISIVRDPKLHNITLSNMPLKKTESYGMNLKVDHFEKSHLMSTYLVAFVVSDFGGVTKNTASGTKISVYAPPDLIGQTLFALNAAVKITEYYEHFFGVPYPLPKQDLVAIPDFDAGAMENWGLITYRSTDLLYDKEKSSLSNQQRVAVVVAHELAHQWFGNLVTMKWWSDLWLNEGFATFVEYIGSDLINKNWQMQNQLLEALQDALFQDSLFYSHPISLPVHNPGQIVEIFDTISYSKGMSILRMVKGFLSTYKLHKDHTLQKGLQAYLKKHSYGNAETNDLWNSLSQATGNKLDVTKVMSTWTNQMGYPLVTMTRSGNKVIAKQSRFLVSHFNKSIKSEFTSPNGYRWHIPLTLITEKSNNTIQKWMHPEDKQVEITIDSNVNWYKANIGQIGFYRVTYDKDNWIALINQLKNNHKYFSVADRSSFIDDAFNLAISNDLDPVIALNLALYLQNESDYIVWNTAWNNLHFLSNILEDDYDSLSLMNKFILKLFNNLLKKMKFEDTGHLLEKYLRSLVLNVAVMLGDKETVTKATNIYKIWKADPTYKLAANLRNTIYRAGITYGTVSDWEYMWSLYRNSSIDAPAEANRIMIALTKTTNIQLLNRYLQYSLDKSMVRSQDVSTVLTHISSNRAGGKLIIWQFIKKHWNFYRYKASTFSWRRVVKTSKNFNTQFDYDEVKKYFSTHDLGSAKRTGDQALEYIQFKSEWLKKHKDNVTKWLRKIV